MPKSLDVLVESGNHAIGKRAKRTRSDLLLKASGQLDFHGDIAARGIGIRANLVRAIHQGLRSGAVHAGEADRQAHGNAKAMNGRAEIDFGIHRQI